VTNGAVTNGAVTKGAVTDGVPRAAADSAEGQGGEPRRSERSRRGRGRGERSGERSAERTGERSAERTGERGGKRSEKPAEPQAERGPSTRSRRERPRREADQQRPPRREPREPREDEESGAPQGIAHLDQAKLEAVAREVTQKLLLPLVENAQVSVELLADRVCVKIEDPENTGLLIGREGQTLASIQYLVNRLVSKRMDASVRVQIDAGDYRENQDERLRQIARHLADKTTATGRTQSTRPMSSYHRRVVHLTLQDDEFVFTRSKGEGVRLTDDNAIIQMVQKVMRDELKRLKTCYTDQLKVDETLQGAWVLNFTVAASGKTKEVSIAAKDAENTALEQCMAKKMNTWEFQPIKADLPVRKTVTFRPS